MSTEALLQPAWLDSQHSREGRYILGPLLGQGGMGEVREAWDVVLRRTVALKILRAMNPVSLIRFMHEAQLQARVVHPNICMIYDVESAEGAPRIAMQRVQGATLAEVAHQLSIEELIPLFAQVAEAVHAAHKHKLIHRDLKPSNILMERTAEGAWIPYVCDFGLAMILDEPALTYSQGIKGTPAYMAPEQIRGERNLIGPATDIYALGGTLFYAIFGQVPLGVAVDIETLMGKRPRPLTLPPSPKQALPKELETILRKCLEPNPAQRFSSMAQVAQELRRLSEGLPIHTQPLGVLEQYLPFLRNHRKASFLALLAAGGLALGLGLVHSRLSLAQERRAEWTRMFALEAAEMDNDLRIERMLPVHDLRPTYAHLRQHMAGIRARIQALGPDAEGPGHYALARARFLLKDFAGAEQELEQAWAKGCRGPEVAYLLARALAGAEERKENQIQFATGLPSPSRSQTAQRVEALFRQGRSLANDPDEFARAITAFTQRDYGQAATAAHASFLTHPWHFESAATEALSLYALGRQKYEAGDLAGAASDYREAMEAAKHFLTLGQSDEGVHHAYLLAGRGLAFLQWRQGALPLKTVDELLRHSQEALRLDPDDPQLQDDRLVLHSLKAARMADLGQDPAPELSRALAFLGSRTKEPLTPELRADRMLLHWQVAKHQFSLGQDPSQALAEALKDPGHTRFLHRDFLGEILNFKAEVESIQGLDPRPTLADAQARFAPILRASASGSLCEMGAESWLIRADWEASHGLDASDSLRNARALAGRAIKTNANSPGAYALEGLACALENQGAPGHRFKTAMARGWLTASLSHGPSPHLQARLRREIED